MSINQKIFNTTLAYIEKDGKYLMLYRNKKKNDINNGKWIGIEGKLEFGEAPEECIEREVFEETGLEVTGYVYSGLITFVYEKAENYRQLEDNETANSQNITEYMHLFKVTDFEGELKECDEGELRWIDKNKLLEIPHFKGDEFFLSLIKDNKPTPFFTVKLSYLDDVLEEVLLDTVPCFITDNLILRPWSENDVSDLYKYAKDPEIGPSAGWLPHKNLEESRKVIDDVLMLPGTYAIVLKKTNEVIGSIALQVGSKEKRGLGSEPLQAEIGYWLAKPYWGNGFTPEAARVLIKFGFEELKVNKIWIAYFDGNERSRRVTEKLGFTYSHTVERKIPALKSIKMEHFTVQENYIKITQ